MGTGKSEKSKYEKSYFCKNDFCKKLIRSQESTNCKLVLKENTAFLNVAVTPWTLETFKLHIASFRSLAQARLKSTPTGLVAACNKNEETLLNEIRNLIGNNSFSPALRCLTFAIDKCRSEKEISNMNEEERLSLCRLYIKRAQLYQLMTVKFQKTRYAKLALEDCEFLKTFGFDLIKNENGSLHKDLERIEKNASEFIAGRTSSIRRQKSENNNRRHQQNSVNRRSNQTHTNRNQRQESKALNEVFDSIKIISFNKILYFSF